MTKRTAGESGYFTFGSSPDPTVSNKAGFRFVSMALDAVQTRVRIAATYSPNPASARRRQTTVVGFFSRTLLRKPGHQFVIRSPLPSPSSFIHLTAKQTTEYENRVEFPPARQQLPGPTYRARVAKKKTDRRAQLFAGSILASADHVSVRKCE